MLHNASPTNILILIFFKSQHCSDFEFQYPLQEVTRFEQLHFKLTKKNNPFWNQLLLVLLLLLLFLQVVCEINICLVIKGCKNSVYFKLKKNQFSFILNIPVTVLYSVMKIIIPVSKRANIYVYYLQVGYKCGFIFIKKTVGLFIFLSLKFYPVRIYLSKVNNRNTRTMFKM